MVFGSSQKRREPRPMEKYRNISKSKYLPSLHPELVSTLTYLRVWLPDLFPHREPKKGLPGAACNCIKSRRGQPRCTDNSCMNRFVVCVVVLRTILVSCAIWTGACSWNVPQTSVPRETNVETRDFKRRKK